MGPTARLSTIVKLPTTGGSNRSPWQDEAQAPAECSAENSEFHGRLPQPLIVFGSIGRTGAKLTEQRVRQRATVTVRSGIVQVALRREVIRMPDWQRGRPRAAGRGREQRDWIAGARAEAQHVLPVVGLERRLPGAEEIVRHTETRRDVLQAGVGGRRNHEVAIRHERGGPEVLIGKAVLEVIEAQAGVDRRALERPPVLGVDAEFAIQVLCVVNGSACCSSEIGTPLANL